MSKLNKVYNDVLALREFGRINGSSNVTDIDSKYNTNYILTMSKNMTLLEIRTLLELSKLREQGLAFVREKKFNKAFEFLNRSRVVESGQGLSEEAILVANSFQGAAEAYYFHKKGENATALELLNNSIDSLEKLSKSYEYSAEVRKIHLYKNTIRVRTDLGNYKDAIKLSLSLLHYLHGDMNSLDYLGAVWKTKEKLERDEKSILIDQILAEMSNIQKSNHLSICESSDFIESTVSVLNKDPKMKKVCAFLLATLYLSKNNWLDFLKSAMVFYKPGLEFFYFSSKQMDQNLEFFASKKIVANLI